MTLVMTNEESTLDRQVAIVQQQTNRVLDLKAELKICRQAVRAKKVEIRLAKRELRAGRKELRRLSRNPAALAKIVDYLKMQACKVGADKLTEQADLLEDSLSVPIPPQDVEKTVDLINQMQNLVKDIPESKDTTVFDRTKCMLDDFLMRQPKLARR